MFAPVIWYIRSVEIPVVAFGGFYVCLQILPLILLVFHLSSALLHLMGMLVGFPIAIFMLRRGWVDCEGWDLLSRFGSSKTRTSLWLNPLWLIGRLFGDSPGREDADFHASLRSEN